MLQSSISYTSFLSLRSTDPTSCFKTLKHYHILSVSSKCCLTICYISTIWRFQSVYSRKFPLHLRLTCIQLLCIVPVMICSALYVDMQVANPLIKQSWKVILDLFTHAIHIVISHLSCLNCNLWLVALVYWNSCFNVLLRTF